MRAVRSLALSAVVLACGGLLAVACGENEVTIPPPPDAGLDAHADTGTGGGSDSGVTNDGSVTADDSGSSLLTNGTACVSGSQCDSGHCADGVCCDTACNGTCESCKVGNTPGTCTAVPDGTDPDTECGADPTFDAGAPPFDGGYDASLPPTNPNQCAGHCDGNRACAFAASGTTCGATFCGNPSEQGSAQCDGKGHCLVDVTECSVYACPDGTSGCKSSCKSSDDCLKPYYCNLQSMTCVPKSADGTACTSADQCASGACTTFYRDADGDGYGTKKTNLAGATTQVCGTTPPPNYAATSDDCFDSLTPIAKSVHPGQTDWFATGYTIGNGGGNPSFDYDCSGTEEKETADSATCGFCDHFIFEPAPPVVVDRCAFEPTCGLVSDAPAHACGGPTGCTADNSPAFPSTTKCGDTAATITCGACSADGSTSAEIPGEDKQERCH